ncbi:MAG: hypothetical protein IJ917_07830, partial [Firmicutes bacterium]|nr:hypothetical protein [Bacillota bacterium]
LSIEDARGCLDAVTRMNIIFRQLAKVDVLIFRDDYLSHGLGSEFCLYEDNGLLTNRGYSYEFASEELLFHPNATVRDHELDQDGAGYRCLLIPGAAWISVRTLKRVFELHRQGLPVFWVGAKPSGKKYHGESDQEWQQMMENCRDIPVIWDILDVPDVLEATGIQPRVRLDGHKDVMTAVRDEADVRYCCLYAYNRVVLDQEHPNPDELAVSAIYRKGSLKRSYERPGTNSRGSIFVQIEGVGQVSRMDPFSGKIEELSFTEKDGRMEGALEIEEDEMVFLAMEKGKVPQSTQEYHLLREHSVTFRTIAFSSFEPNTPEETSFLRSHFEPYGEEIPLEQTVSWPAMGRERFAGRALYKAEIDLAEVDPQARYVLELGDVEDTFHVRINGLKAPFPDQVMKRVDLTGLLVQGQNQLEIEVTSNLYNKLFTEEAISSPYAPKLPILTRSYGIRETEGKKIRVLEYA